MSDFIEIQPCGPLATTMRPPGSKSITNRALICAALAPGESVLRGALDSDDTQVMIAALRQLGVAIREEDNGEMLYVTGVGGKFTTNDGKIYAAASGTTMRFLAAMLPVAHGRFRLDGTARMRERPLADLIDALQQLGGNIRSEAGNGCPPVVIESAGLPGRTAQIRGNISSQFLSGLLMAAPYAQNPVTLRVQGELVSKPYVTMTLAVMESFGVQVQAADDLSEFVIEPSAYSPQGYSIEPDASAASYFFAAAAVAGGTVTVEGLQRCALQGDVAFIDCLERMGCEVKETSRGLQVTGAPLRGIEVDMNPISDTVQTLAAVALFATGPTVISGVEHIRHKETDRLSALATELRKLGATVEERQDGLTITPGPLHGADVATYDDHRMAMSLAIAGLKIPGVKIHDPGCTAKTYPRFFEDLQRVTNPGKSR